MVVRVNRLARADRLAGELAAAIGDHFVRIRIRACARASLKNVEREMFIELAFDNFLCGLDNECAPICVQQTEIVIGLRSRPF